MAKRSKSKRLPQIPPWEDIERLIKAADTNRDRLMLMLMAYCGLRVSEVTKLRTEHLDFRRGQLFVSQGKGDRDRYVPIPGFMSRPLRGFLGTRKGPVFQSRKGGRALTTRAVQHLVKRVAAKAGFPNADKARAWHPHLLRHEAATSWLDGGGTIYDVKELLGHSSIQTTEKYLHTTMKRLAEVVNLGVEIARSCGHP